MTNKEIKKMLKDLEDKIDNIAYRDPPLNEYAIAGIFIGSLVLAAILQYLIR